MLHLKGGPNDLFVLPCKAMYDNAKSTLEGRGSPPIVSREQFILQEIEPDALVEDFPAVDKNNFVPSGQ